MNAFADLEAALDALDVGATRLALDSLPNLAPDVANRWPHAVLSAFEARHEAVQFKLGASLQATPGAWSRPAIVEFLRQELEGPQASAFDLLKLLAKAVPSLDWSHRHDGRTPLLRCAALGLGKAMSWLIQQQEQDPGQSTPGGRTAAHLAAEGANIGVLRRLAGFDVPLDTPDGEGKTPGHLAAKLEHLIVLRELKRLGADLSAADVRGRTVAQELDLHTEGLGAEWLAWEREHEARLRGQRLEKDLPPARAPSRPRM